MPTPEPAATARKVIQIAQHRPAGCEGAAKPAADLSPDIREKIKNHPCYSEEAHRHFARMHVAVAPACNIQCNYCNRKFDCSNESRPGVVSEKLTPEQALAKVLAVAAEIPQLTVVGIAGPGDALGLPERTFRTFELIRAHAPDLKLCLSTNGLALPDHVRRLKALDVDHVTVTVNAIDPRVAERIYPWIYFRGRRLRGPEAAKILLERQQEGLELLKSAGILAKVNSVLIPGVNDEHLVEVNKAVRERGAFLHNIMPLISAPEHGTHFGVTGQRAPTAQELKAIQDRCEGGASLMRHCRQCRADAVGMLGEDRSAEFTLERLAQRPAAYDPAPRQAYQAFVDRERDDQRAAREAALAAVAQAGEASILVAVASRGGGRINEHFGHASEFYVYEVSAEGARFIGHRRVDHYCEGGYGEDDALETVLKAINDCSAVLVAKIGRCPEQALKAAGIEPVQDYAHEYIEAALLAWFRRHLDRLARGEARPRRGDAALRQGAFVA